MQRFHKRLVISLGTLCGAFLPGSVFAMPHDGFTDPRLPPIHIDLRIRYYNHEVTHGTQQVQIRNSKIGQFERVHRQAVATDEIQIFDAQLDATVDAPTLGLNDAPMMLTGPMQTIARNYSSGQLGTFQTEVQEMSLTGSVNSMPVLLRESPTLSSFGQVSISAGSSYIINSFFDVWTELSLDGGQTWVADINGPAHFELCPEPAAMTVVAMGALVLARRRSQQESRMLNS